MTHTFAAGQWEVQSAADAGLFTVISEAVTLRRPKLVGYRHRLAFRGAIVPALPNQHVLLLENGAFFAATTTLADGTFVVPHRISARVRTPPASGMRCRHR